MIYRITVAQGDRWRDHFKFLETRLGPPDLLNLRDIRYLKEQDITNWNVDDYLDQPTYVMTNLSVARRFKLIFGDP